MFPAGVDARASLVLNRGIVRVGARSTASRRTRELSLRRMTERHLADGERQTGTDVGEGPHRGASEERQLSKLYEEHAVRGFGEHPFHRTECPLVVPWKLRQRLRPVTDDLIGSREIPSAPLTRDGSEAIV